MIDPAGLVGVFDRTRFEAWTGVRFGPMQSLEWLYLWLACVLETGLCSMSVGQGAVDAGVVEPLFRTATMAVPGQRELCYLTGRSVGHTEDGGKITAMGKEATVPADAEVIDVTGKHVYPGLFDALTDLGLVEINSVRATLDAVNRVLLRRA